MLDQVQALVAEHRLGAAGRKRGAAMTKELVNTPGRLALVKPAASVSWAAIKQRKQKAQSARLSKQSSKAASLAPSEASSMGRTASQELLDASLDDLTAKQLQGAAGGPQGASRQPSSVNDMLNAAEVLLLVVVVLMLVTVVLRLVAVVHYAIHGHAAMLLQCYRPALASP